MSPADVLLSRKADARNRDIFYVALCRAMGLEEELNPLTGSAKVDASGTLVLTYDGKGTPEYYYQFTISRILPDGSTKLCTVGEDSDHNPWDTISPLELEPGYYMLTSGRRLADGSVLAHSGFFTIAAGRTTIVPLVLRDAEEQLTVLGTMDADRFLSGRAAVIIFSRFLETGTSRQSTAAASWRRWPLSWKHGAGPYCWKTTPMAQCWRCFAPV